MAAAAAPVFDNDALLDKLFSLISERIVINDKFRAEKATRPDISEAAIRQTVTARSRSQLREAREFLGHIITNYLRDGDRFKLSAKMANGHKHTFTPAANGFNRIVLVDFENARMGLLNAPSIGIHGSVNDYIFNLARSDSNALYILVRSVNLGNHGSFRYLHNNIIECNVDFHPHTSNYGINYNETDDFVMLALLKLLVDKQAEMFGLDPVFGQYMPVYVISADNYSWFTPRNVLQANEPHIQGRTYPHVVYYSPILGGQWCHYKSANNNERVIHQGGQFTSHKSQGSRKHSAFHESLSGNNYYNSDVFPTREMLDTGAFVSSPNRPTHPIFGDICNLRMKVKVARAIPPGYVQERPGSNIYYNDKHIRGLRCIYNADTGEFSDERCDTWTDKDRAIFESHELGPSGKTSKKYAQNQSNKRRSMKSNIAAKEAAYFSAMQAEIEAQRALRAKQARLDEQVKLAKTADDAYNKVNQTYDNRYIQQLFFYTDDLEKFRNNQIDKFIVKMHKDLFIKILYEIIELKTSIDNIKSNLDDKKLTAELSKKVNDINEIIREIQNKIDNIPSEINDAEKHAEQAVAEQAAAEQAVVDQAVVDQADAEHTDAEQAAAENASGLSMAELEMYIQSASDAFLNAYTVYETIDTDYKKYSDYIGNPTVIQEKKYKHSNIILKSIENNIAKIEEQSKIISHIRGMIGPHADNPRIVNFFTETNSYLAEAYQKLEAIRANIIKYSEHSQYGGVKRTQGNGPGKNGNGPGKNSQVNAKRSRKNVTWSRNGPGNGSRKKKGNGPHNN